MADIIFEKMKRNLFKLKWALVISIIFEIIILVIQKNKYINSINSINSIITFIHAINLAICLPLFLFGTMFMFVLLRIFYNTQNNKLII